MLLIIIISIILYAVVIAWTWHNLGEIDKVKKVAVILIGIIVMYIISLTIFYISKGQINYPNEILETKTRRILVILFTGLNSLIVLPYISKQFDKIHEGDIEKQTFTRKIVILLIILSLCAWFESGYINNVQEGIIKIYQSNS